MNPEEFLKQKFLSCTNRYSIALEAKTPLYEKICNHLFSKKFRKWKIDDSIRLAVSNLIKENISQNKPIEFVYPYGDYKHYSLENSPNVGWAEFFFLVYYIEYLAPITKIYTPGVKLKILSDDVAMTTMDNYPEDFMETHIASFRDLLKEFKKIYPNNFSIEIVRTCPDIYPTRGEYFKEADQRFIELKKDVSNMDPKIYEVKFNRSEFNIFWKGKNDWTTLNEEARKQKIQDGLIWHDAAVTISGRHKFVRGGDKVLIFSSIVPNAIPIGTTQNSVVKFWTGEGILEHFEDKFSTRVLSPLQYSSIKDKLSKVNVDFLKLKNFESIQIYNERLNYKN